MIGELRMNVSRWLNHINIHYNNSPFPWRHVGAFPSDMSLGKAIPSDMSLGNTSESFMRDSFPSDNPQRRGVGIFHQKSVPRTPQQNGVVERRNRTLVEAARTMMIFSKAPMFYMGEAVSHCFYNPEPASLLILVITKSPVELVHVKSLDSYILPSFWTRAYHYDPGKLISGLDPNQYTRAGDVIST
ncbi:retrovirus-related pol polyprotein from transposon TNT 1-94 [Tanacetum coccineum]